MNSNELAAVGRRIHNTGEFTDELHVAQEIAQLVLRPDTNISVEPLSTSVARLASAFIVAGAQGAKMAADIEELQGLVVKLKNNLADANTTVEEYKKFAGKAQQETTSASRGSLLLFDENAHLRAAVNLALRSRTITPSMRRKIVVREKCADACLADRNKIIKKAMDEKTPTCDSSCCSPYSYE